MAVKGTPPKAESIVFRMSSSKSMVINACRNQVGITPIDLDRQEEYGTLLSLRDEHEW